MLRATELGNLECTESAALNEEIAIRLSHTYPSARPQKMIGSRFEIADCELLRFAFRRERFVLVQEF